MNRTIRSITDDEVPAYITMKGQAFGYHATEDGISAWRRNNDIRRALVAEDDGEFVGATASYALHLQAPGSVMPCSGIAGVAVPPTHRRRGILRELLHHQLQLARAEGFAIAALWPSESAIYGRFGFAPATQSAGVTCTHAPPTAEQHRGFTLRFLADIPKEPLSRDFGRLGQIERLPWQQEQLVGPRASGAFGPPFIVGAFRGADIVGYAVYRYHHDRLDHDESASVRIDHVSASTPGVGQALWDFLRSLDLVTRWQAPLTDPALLPPDLAEAAKPGAALWVRILDVERALSTRTYEQPGSWSFTVEDSVLSEAEGTFTLEVDNDGTGRCFRTKDEATTTVSIAELSSAVLGLATASGAPLLDALRTPAQPFASAHF